MLSQKPNGYRYFVEFAYNGKPYHGWQIQPNALTVQEDMNKAFSTILGEDLNMVGAGRTDTGVHASHFVAHMDLVKEISDPEGLVFKANRFLNGGINISRIQLVDPDLHARFSALSRTYHYIISRDNSPFMDDFSWFCPREMNLDSIREATEKLKRVTDFTSFARLHADNKTNDCKIMDAEWAEYGSSWVFKVKADRFLRNMVRAIVGTLVDVGAGKTSQKEFMKIIDAKDRSAAGQSAPAKGLFLTHVEYPKDGFQTSPRSPFYRFF